MNKSNKTTNEQNENKANKIRHFCCTALFKSPIISILGVEHKKFVFLLKVNVLGFSVIAYQRLALWTL